MQDKSLLEDKQKSAIPNVVYGVVLLFLASQLLWALWNYADVAVAAINFPFPLDYGEGPILDQVMRLLHGENIYRPDLAQAPWVMSNYPPLFHLLQLRGFIATKENRLSFFLYPECLVKGRMTGGCA